MYHNILRFAILLTSLLAFQACTTEKIIDNTKEMDQEALRDSIYASLKDSILEDFEDQGYDSILEDSIFDRLYTDFYQSEMDRIQAKYDSLLSARVTEILTSQDSLIQSKDSAAAAQIDSLRTTLYDSLYSEVYDELYSASAISNVYVKTYGFYPTIHPGAYPFQDSIYGDYLSSKLAFVTVKNLSTKNAYYLVLKSGVNGATAEGKVTVPINPGQEDTLWVHPALNWNYFKDLAEIENTQIDISLSVLNNNRESIIWTATKDIKVEPINFLPPRYGLKAGGYANVWPLVSQWVLNTGDSISAIVKKAASFHASGNLAGYQNPSKVLDSIGLISAQVKAIYQAIQSRNISYVSEQFSPTGQRIKFPEQTLRSRTANCIDGTILFAAVLEAIGLQPVIIIIPGHSFLGWKVWTDSDTVDYLETTFTWSGATFDDAVEKAREEFQTEIDLGNFQNGNSQILDIGTLQQSGLTAFPIQVSF